MRAVKRVMSIVLGRNRISPPHSATENEPTFGLSFEGSARPAFKVGRRSYFGGVTVYCWDPRIELVVGSFCSFASEISIVAGGEHDKDWVTTYPIIELLGIDALRARKKPRWKGSINIGHDVWIGARVLILSGVTIGTGAVIGAGSVVVKDIPPYTIAAGNPARPIRRRFSQEICDALLRSKWWTWSDELIKARANDFLNPELFAQKYGAAS